jgi:hypothetical protein
MEDITDLLKIYKVKNTDDLVKYIRGKVNFNAYKNNQRLQEISEAPNSIKDGLIERPLVDLYERKQVREGYLFPDEILTDDQVLKEVIEEEIINLCYHYDEVSDDNIFVESEAIRIINIQIERLTLLKSIEQYKAVNSPAIPLLKKGKDGKKPKQPNAKDVMEAFNQIDNEKKITAKECSSMLVDEKYQFISNWIKKAFGYTFAALTLEKVYNELQNGGGYRIAAYNILNEKSYTEIATRYKIKFEGN